VKKSRRNKGKKYSTRRDILQKGQRGGSQEKWGGSGTPGGYWV